LEIRQCGADVTIEQVQKHPTVTALAEIIDKCGNVEDCHPVSTAQHSVQNILHPLTHHQKMLLNNHLIDPENIRDNIVFKYVFAPQTDTKRLVNALRQCLAAHPLLNARLIKDGDVYFWKRNENTVSMSGIDDVAECGVITDEELLQKEKSFDRPFSLTSGEPLYNFEICKTSTAVVLLCRIHHMIFDAVSQKIFINEIADAYNSETGNNCIPNEIGIGALTAGQQEQEQLASVEMDANYDELINRIEKCGGLPKLKEQKQLDNPAGRLEEYRGNQVSSEQIRNFCNNYHLSPNTVFAVAFATAVSRHSDNSSVLFMFVKSGRDDFNLSMIGAFVQSVPMVIRYDSHLSLLENCRTAQADIKLAMQYGFPILWKHFEQKSGSLWQMSIVGATMLYIFHGNLLDESKIHLVEGQRVAFSFLNRSNDDSTPQMSMEFVVYENDGKYDIVCKYNNAMFDKTFIEQFIREIENHIKELIDERQVYSMGQYPLSRE
jgi:hypothetical protein